MIEFEITYSDKEVVARFASMSKELNSLVRAKIVSVTEVLLKIAQENVSGKILQTKSGELLKKIQMQTFSTENFSEGKVFVDNPGDKEFALEYGGKGDYLISVKTAALLHYFTNSGVEKFRPWTIHPPSQAFKYIGSLVEEAPELLYRALNDAIRELSL